MSKVNEAMQHAPVGVLVAWMAGLHLDIWLTVLSLVWLLWLYYDKLRTKWREWKDRRDVRARLLRRVVVEKVVAKRDASE